MFCIAINPHGGKEARVNAVQPAIESGHVFLPEGAPWLADYIDQWCAFPAGAHDDMVDSSTLALGYLLFSSGAALPTAQPEKEDSWLNGFDDILADTNTLFDPYGAY
jgi:phage terminase large subunit-like protein